jgi:hypothetical protein
MNAIILLADAAQTAGGKLYILGGGWSITSTPTPPSALAIKIDVPWDQANRRHHLAVELLDADGRPVLADGRPVAVSGDVEVGRPPGLLPGTPLDVVLAIPVGPLPLAPACHYVWRLSINGETQAHWTAGFTTRPSAP